MEKVEKVTIENREAIEDIIFKYPSLMSEKAKTLLMEEYLTLLKTKEALSKTRESVRQLELEHSQLLSDWQNKQSLFDIKYDTKDVSVNIYNSGTMIKNSGNDLIGRSTRL